MVWVRGLKDTGGNNNRTRPNESDATRRPTTRYSMTSNTRKKKRRNTTGQKEDIETTIWHVITKPKKTAEQWGWDGMPLKELKAEKHTKSNNSWT